MAYGFGGLGWIGMAPEASGGVAATPALYSHALSESLKLDINRFELANITGRLTEPDDAAGVRNPGGDIVMGADPRNLGYALAAILFPTQIGVVVSGTIYSHLFRPHTTGNWDQRYTLPPYTLVAHRDVGQAQVYTGCVCTGLELGVTPNEAISVKTQWVGTDFATASYATPSPASLQASSQFRFDAVSLTVAGVGRVDIEGFRLQISQPAEPVATLRGSAYPYKVPASDYRKVRGTLVVAFEDITDKLAFINQAEQSIKLCLAQGSFSAIFEMPRCVFTTYPTGIGGRGRQVIEATFTARTPVGSHALEVSLVSPVPYHVIPPAAFALLAS